MNIKAILVIMAITVAAAFAYYTFGATSSGSSLP